MMIFDLSNFLASKDVSFHLEGEIESRTLPKESNIKVISPIRFAGDIFKVDVVKKIDNRTSTPYLDIIGEPKRILLEKSGELAKFLRTKINVADKDNPKLQKWKLSLKTSNEIVSCLGLDCIQKIIDNPIQLLNYPHLKLNYFLFYLHILLFGWLFHHFG